MRARQLLDRSVPLFGERTMAVVYEAFDEAWASIARRYGDDPAAFDAARFALAEAMLSVAREDSDNAEQLKLLALQMMRLRS